MGALRTTSRYVWLGRTLASQSLASLARVGGGIRGLGAECRSPWDIPETLAGGELLWKRAMG